MKTNAIIRIIIWSLVILILVSILAAGLIARVAYDSFKGFRSARESGSISTLEPVADPSAFQPEAYAFPAADYTKLAIEWVAGDITILASKDTDEIRIQEETPSDSRYAMQYRASGRTLKLIFCQEHLSIGINKGETISKDLTIEVPADWICEELELDVAAVNLDVRNLAIREVDFDGASGTCNFADCDVTDLDIDTASGDVTFSGTLNTLDFDAASASFIGQFLNTPSRIDMDGMSGDLDITLPEDTGFSVSIDGMSSSVRSDFYGTENRNGNHVYGDGRCRIQVDGMSCDVTIRKLDTITADNAP